MNNPISNPADILDRAIGGFRQYQLEEPIHPSFVSRNLCEMTGYTREELTREQADVYARLIHPSDRPIYADLLRRAAGGAGDASAQYRLVRKDGTVIHVSDRITVGRDEAGHLVGYAVLCDITSLKSESDNLRFLNDTVPCGLLKYTCEKNPRVTYFNDRMLEILRFPAPREGEMDYLEFYKENIYLMIPMEERRKFSHFLSQVYTKGAPIAGEISVLRCDGTRARLYGWVTKVVDEQGREEFQSVCMDVTERYRTKRAGETERYLKALSDVYDKIFEYDLTAKTVKYLHGGPDATFGSLVNIPMQLEEATERWIEQAVVAEDRDAVRTFFETSLRGEAVTGEGQPPQIRFSVTDADGSRRGVIGIFLKLDTAVSLFCCRNTAGERGAEADSLRDENRSLRSMNENMQEFVMRFTEGIAAFEVRQDLVTPLYASDNVCEFFGFDREQWLSMMQKTTSIREFVSHSGVGYEKFSELLQNGEAEFTYRDIGRGIVRRIKAICSQKHAEGDAPRYVMLYNLDDTASERSRIYIRTFGYFDVFVDDKPIAFRNKKAKELFALLVDRRGGYVSSEEAISFLWEDEAVSAVTLARYRKEALRLKNTLEEYGISDVIESVDGKRRIVPERVRCDLYDYLGRREEYAELFKGSYLTNYSWGEVTLGELMSKSLYGGEL